METKYFGEFRDVYSKAAGDVYSKAVREMYSKAVSEMYSQFKQREAHPMEKYIGKLARRGCGEVLEVVGYSRRFDGSYALILDRSQSGGWTVLDPRDVIFKECKSYWYASIDDLID